MASIVDRVVAIGFKNVSDIVPVYAALVSLALHGDSEVDDALKGAIMRAVRDDDDPIGFADHEGLFVTFETLARNMRAIITTWPNVEQRAEAIARYNAWPWDALIDERHKQEQAVVMKAVVELQHKQETLFKMLQQHAPSRPSPIDTTVTT